MKLYNIFRYGIMKRLRKGDSALLFLTFRCTLKCSYCSLKYIDGIYPSSSEIDLSDWKRIVKDFPRKLREIKITGGEPMIQPYFVEFVNWLTDNGYFVFVLTNLTIKVKGLKPSNKLMLCATHHQGIDADKWKKNLEHYQKDFRVEVEEIDFGEVDGSYVKNLGYRESGDTCMGFLYAPDGKLYTRFNELVEAHVSR